jgi:hypothetical protein
MIAMSVRARALAFIAAYESSLFIARPNRAIVQPCNQRARNVGLSRARDMRYSPQMRDRTRRRAARVRQVSHHFGRHSGKVGSPSPKRTHERS